MFDIAMNTKGALSFDNLSGLGGGSNTQGNANMGMSMGGQPQNMGNQGMPMNNQGMNTQGMNNQGMGMPMGNQHQNFNQNMNTQGMSIQQPNNQMNQQPNNQMNRQTNNMIRPQAPTPQANVTHYEAQAKGGVILKKGGKTSLSKMVGANGKLQKIDVCLGWDVGSYGNYDLDSSCFILGGNDKVIGDDWFVFYNQPVSPDGSITHNGDNKTGAGDGDDEIITVDLTRISPQVKKLAFVITINEAIENGYSFKNIANAYVRVVDKMSGKELAFFNLSDYYDGVTAMTVCEIYNHNGDWKINPVGNGLKGTDLMGLCGFYGVNVAG